MANRGSIVFLGAVTVVYSVLFNYMTLGLPLWLAIGLAWIWVYFTIVLFRDCECGRKKRPYQ